MNNENDPKNTESDNDRILLDDSNPEDLNLEANMESSASSNEELEKQKKENLYLRAEFDNFRKQSIKERSDLVKFGAERIARDLLNVIDILDQAMSIEVTADTLKSFTEGIDLTAKELTKTLEKHGITEIDCKGKAYNPMNAEALSQVPSDQVDEGHVLEVMRKGYAYHHKVLRPAQVVLATKPEQTNDDATEGK